MNATKRQFLRGLLITSGLMFTTGASALVRPPKPEGAVFLVNNEPIGLVANRIQYNEGTGQSWPIQYYPGSAQDIWMSVSAEFAGRRITPGLTEEVRAFVVERVPAHTDPAWVSVLIEGNRLAIHFHYPAPLKNHSVVQVRTMHGRVE